MSILKSDIVNGAFSRARISGLTKSPGAEDNELALDLLDSLMAEWELRGYCIGYKIPDADQISDLADPSGIDRKYKYAVECALAGRIIVDYGKEISQALALAMSGSFSALAASTAVQQQTQYPSNMPRGSGSTIRYNRWNRYFRKAVEAPISCDTIYMHVGEINSYQEDYTAYLNDGEAISSFTTEVDDGIVITASAINSDGDIISYTVRADGTAENQSPFLQMKITATTGAGRINIRVINFQLSNDQVGD